jgi:hypothetical protein
VANGNRPARRGIRILFATDAVRFVHGILAGLLPNRQLSSFEHFLRKLDTYLTSVNLFNRLSIDLDLDNHCKAASSFITENDGHIFPLRNTLRIENHHVAPMMDFKRTGNIH